MMQQTKKPVHQIRLGREGGELAVRNRRIRQTQRYLQPQPPSGRRMEGEPVLRTRRPAPPHEMRGMNGSSLMAGASLRMTTAPIPKADLPENPAPPAGGTFFSRQMLKSPFCAAQPLPLLSGGPFTLGDFFVSKPPEEDSFLLSVHRLLAAFGGAFNDESFSRMRVRRPVSAPAGRSENTTAGALRKLLFARS